jgi:hypothetical protein
MFSPLPRVTRLRALVDHYGSPLNDSLTGTYPINPVFYDASLAQLINPRVSISHVAQRPGGLQAPMLVNTTAAPTQANGCVDLTSRTAPLQAVISVPSGSSLYVSAATDDAGTLELSRYGNFLDYTIPDGEGQLPHTIDVSLPHDGYASVQLPFLSSDWPLIARLSTTNATEMTICSNPAAVTGQNPGSQGPPNASPEPSAPASPGQASGAPASGAPASGAPASPGQASGAPASGQMSSTQPSSLGTAALTEGGTCNLDQLDGAAAAGELQPQNRSAFSVAGWGADVGNGLAPTSTYFVLRDAAGQLWFQQAQTVSRPDVAAHFGIPALTLSGYQAVVDATQLPSGDYDVQVAMQFSDHSLLCNTGLKMRL